jgi:HAD superfamily hydrolase (TIGR01509 family)
MVFDFNGVLVDDEPIHLRMFQRVLGEEGVALSDRDYHERYLGLDDRGCFAAALAAAGRPAEPARVMRLIVRKAAYYQEAIRRQGYPFFPGAAELVAAAGEAGLMLGVVSGALRDEVEPALRQAGLWDHFKVVVTAEDVDAGKPDPAGYRRALADFNSRPPLPARLLHPHEALAIEDSPAGLQAAASAGLATLAVAHTYPQAGLADADRVVARLADVKLPELLALYTEISSA